MNWEKILIITSIFLILINLTTAYTVEFYHSDHLGSPSVVTDESGGVVWSADYDTFGEAINEKGDNDLKYNSKEEDKTGLLYYGARYYNPETGRFITTDTVKGDVLDSQSQNRYVYVKNNPLKYIDLIGNQANNPLVLLANDPDILNSKEKYINLITQSLGLDSVATKIVGSEKEFIETIKQGVWSSFFLYAHGNYNKILLSSSIEHIKSNKGNFLTIENLKDADLSSHFSEGAKGILISCNTGSCLFTKNNFAQTLSNSLSIPISAPKTTIPPFFSEFKINSNMDISVKLHNWPIFVATQGLNDNNEGVYLEGNFAYNLKLNNDNTWTNSWDKYGYQLDSTGYYNSNTGLGGHSFKTRSGLPKNINPNNLFHNSQSNNIYKQFTPTNS
ncbi:MAG: RHS domain-containing protein [Nanoarchaeota archaeon]|nr:RHS domain-containing protein [Nanoarchaeota archaeon]MBU1854666.1 RHS domain-containing protein [Nanoarchaeota archaeon]